MSLYNKYGCGCSSVVPAPTPCCESHTTVTKTDVCFRPTCDVVSNDSSFYLSFASACEQSIPLDVAHVFFFHAATGFMNILEKSGNTYKVELQDVTNAGAIIEKDSCVLLQALPADAFETSVNRCLAGLFTVPVLNASGTMYILNGSGIPIGSTLTFTYEGDTGSYQVTAYVSASGNTYAYTVQNTGNGHTPGTVISGGVSGGCQLPIELITEVDLCDLSTTTQVNTLTGCLNGSPRGLSPTGAGDTIVATDSDTWGLQRITNLDCCVVISDCLKFSGETCPGNGDSVILTDTVPDCFEAAWTAAFEAGTGLAANIDGYPVVFTAYDPETRQVTVEPARPTSVDIPISYPEGTQICLGDCCESCVGYPLITEPAFPGSGDTAPNFGFTEIGLDVPAGTSYWLMGYNNTTGDATTIELDTDYFSAPGDLGPGLPKFSDPMFLRSKICNDHPRGCDQLIEVQFNYLLAFDPIPEDVNIDWEIGHYASGAQTLANGEPNPFNTVSTQQKVNGRLTGPSGIDANLLNTSFGSGNEGSNKVFPYASGDFRDFIFLEKCNCALSIVWFFYRISGVEAPIELNIQFGIRRNLKFFNWSKGDMPFNLPQAQGWNL